jgi:hypothetical protein
VHGPFTISARALGRLPRGPREPGGVDDPAAQPATETASPCADCSESGLPDLSRIRLPRPPFEPDLKATDPNIAASSKYLVVTTRSRVAFYGKDGKPHSKCALLDPTKCNPNIFKTNRFFSPLFKDINKYVNLPEGLPESVYGVDETFDARVLFDEYRKRFWIVAIAQNFNADDGNDVNGNELCEDEDPEELAKCPNYAEFKKVSNAQRGKIVVAVSLSEDPLDGWRLYWWDGVENDGACNVGEPDPPCPPGYDPAGPEEFVSGTDMKNPRYGLGHGADYPLIGVSPDYFTEQHQDAGVPGFVNVVDATKLAEGTCAAGQPGKPPCGHHISRINTAGWPSGDTTHPVGNQVTPAVHHGATPDNLQLLVGPARSTPLGVYGIDPEPGGPLVFAYQAGDVQKLNGPVLARQPPTASVSSPHRVNMGFRGIFMKAVYRAGQLYTVVSDCYKPAGFGGIDDPAECLSTLRLIRRSVYSDVAMPTLDREFGTRGPGDPPLALVHYGWPSLEVNEAGTMVIGEQRSGDAVFPEARFTVRYADEPDNRPSKVLKKGEAPLGGSLAQGDPPDTAPEGKLDITGAAVDPFDDTAVWLIQAYAKDAGGDPAKYRLVVGKVFGKAHPDFTVEQLAVAAGRVLKPGQRILIKLKIGNQGDGRGRGVRGSLYLVRAAARSSQAAAAARRIGIGRLARKRPRPGRAVKLRVRVGLPRALRPGRYRLGVRLRAIGRTRQYDKRNDRVTLPRSIRIGR